LAYFAVVGYCASHAQIISDYPELTEEDVLAALQWAAALEGSERGSLAWMAESIENRDHTNSTHTLRTP
jgi:hypothetical protein